MEYLILILISLVKFLGLIIGVWMVVEGSAPIQWTKELFNINSETKSKNNTVKIISKLLSCCMCTGFWAGLMYYQSIELALVTSLFSELFQRIIGKTLA